MKKVLVSLSSIILLSQPVLAQTTMPYIITQNPVVQTYNPNPALAPANGCSITRPQMMVPSQAASQDQMSSLIELRCPSCGAPNRIYVPRKESKKSFTSNMSSWLHDKLYIK